ncbi:MAG: NAD(P)H-dependent oxidoreductase [Rhizobiales bacterium]|nr:NAD(P)H-dependent oxidoreductase [Hyphomicrobiales bacterium]
MKILAFAASNSTASINKQLVTHAANLIKSDILPDAEIEILDLNDYEMPIYSIDRESSDGIPKLANDFFEKLGKADAIIVSYAEHNFSYTTAYKNIFDWATRINMKIFQDKPVIALSASVGEYGGATTLNAFIDKSDYFGADVKGNLSVGSFGDVFNSEKGILTNADLSAKLLTALQSLNK